MEIVTSDIQLFQILKQKMGDKEAEALVSFVDSKLKENNQVNLKILATKEDIAEVKQDIAEVKIKLAETKSDIIRGVFAFFVTLMLAVIGLYLRQ